jgi:hypothetical protein
MVAARCWPSVGQWRRQSRPALSKPAQLRKPSHLSARGQPRPWTDSDEFRQHTWKRNYDCVPHRADGQSASDNGSETCAETPYETCLLYIHNTHTCHSAKMQISVKNQKARNKQENTHTYKDRDVPFFGPCTIFSH